MSDPCEELVGTRVWPGCTAAQIVAVEPSRARRQSIADLVMPGVAAVATARLST